MKHDVRITSLQKRIHALRSQHSGTSIRYSKEIKRDAVALVADLGLVEASKTLGLARSVLDNWNRQLGSGAENVCSMPVTFVPLDPALCESTSTGNDATIHVTCAPLGLEMNVSIGQLAQLLNQHAGGASC